MVELKNPATKTDIENAILAWMDLLAEKKYSEAFDFTLHDQYYQWSPESIENIINGYGLPFDNEISEKCLVTKWNFAIHETSRHYKDIDLFDTPREYTDLTYLVIGDACYDLPIDGKWSDLTATFKILKSDYFTTLELNEIHVL